MIDEKFVCARCKEKKAENNNNYTFTTYREWENGILCKSCYAYLKSEDYVKEIHTIYPFWIRRKGDYPFWDWTDSISNTKGLFPETRVGVKGGDGGSWYWLISALVQTHGLSIEEVENINRNNLQNYPKKSIRTFKRYGYKVSGGWFKLLFSSHPFPDHQVTLEFAGAGRTKNYYQLYKPKSMTVSGRQLDHVPFILSHNTAIFWFNCNPKYIYLKSELLEETGKK